MSEKITLSHKRSFLILILGAIIALLVLAIFTLNKQLATSAAERVLLPVNEALTIEIAHSNGNTMSMAQAQGNWHITQPVTEPANEQRIAHLLAMLTLPRSGLYPSNDVDLNLLGLESPRATVKINDIEFLLGDSTGNNKRFVFVNDTVFLHPDIVYPLISGGIAAFKINSTQTLTTNAPEQ